MTSRTGSLRDIATILSLMFGALFIVWIGVTVYDQLIAEFMAVPIVANSAASSWLQNLTQAVYLFDYAPLLMYLGALAGTMYLALQIPSSPVFLGISLVAGTFTVYASGIVSNILVEAVNTGPLASTGTILTISSVLVTRLPELTTVSLVLVLIVMYSRSPIQSKRRRF